VGGAAPCLTRAKLKNSSFLKGKSAVFVPGVPGVPTVFDGLNTSGNLYSVASSNCIL
jgi:hypothetical protein